MGGGDLNLKKSWHPNTMKNMERVWKAEQKDSEERKRIAELQREINAERDKEDMQKYAQDTGVVKKKDDVKLEWMYKGPTQSINREDYLLGKAVDKNFEKQNSEQNGSAFQEDDRLPGALREAKASMFSEQVDTARKLHEDPLMAIRQRAIAKAKELYNNPVRLKQIQKMVASRSDDKKHKKDKKKKKKSKKSSKKDEEKMLDALLTEKLKHALKDRSVLRQLKKKAKKDSKESSSSGSEDSDDDSEQRHRHRSDERVRDHEKERDHSKRQRSPLDSNEDKRKYHNSSYNSRDARNKSRSPGPSSSRTSHDFSRRRKSRSSSREREGHPHRQEQYSRHHEIKAKEINRRNCSPDVSRKIKKESTSVKRKTYPDRSPSPASNKRSDKERKDRSKRDQSSSDSSYDSDDSNFKKKVSYGLTMADGSKPVKKNMPTVHEVKPAPSQPKPTPWQRKEKVKLTEEEKERRRQEMMNNASWRDKEREANVKRYRIEEDRERKHLQENFDDEFARKQFSKATEQASVEGRIKSKLNTIQRSRGAMDQHFARR